MTQKMACAIGLLALMLSVGCTKRHAVSPLPEGEGVDLAAWIPEKMEGFLVVSSLEALKDSLELLKKRSSWEQPEKILEALQEGALEELGLDLFSLATWQELGLNTQAPLGFGFNRREEVEVFALPVVDQARFLASLEKHMASGKWEIQPNMPQGLHAWEVPLGNFILLAQKPGYALILTGTDEDLEALKKKVALPTEKSWAKHKDALLKTALRLPPNRVASAWIRMDGRTQKELGLEWVGVGMVMEPRAKVVVDLTWEEGEKPLLPKIQTVPVEPKQWTQSLGDAAGGVWSAATLDWYKQLIKTAWEKWDDAAWEDSEPDKFFKKLDKLGIEPPVLLRSWLQAKAEDGGDDDFRWSADILLREGLSTELLMAWASLLAEKEVEMTQPNPALPIWETKLGSQTLLVHTSGPNKARIADSLHSYEREVPNALQKVVMQEMMGYPISAAMHLNVLMKHSALRYFLGRKPLEKTEYLLLGLRAEENHAQLTGEHFVETDAR